MVLVLYVLQHVVGYRSALSDISRVLRLGGRFCFIDVVHAPLIPRLRTLVPLLTPGADRRMKLCDQRGLNDNGDHMDRPEFAGS